MHKTSYHGNKSAEGRAVTPHWVSVIHFESSQSALGMGPDEGYAHISILWQKEWHDAGTKDAGGQKEEEVDSGTKTAILWGTSASTVKYTNDNTHRNNCAKLPFLLDVKCLTVFGWTLFKMIFVPDNLSCSYSSWLMSRESRWGLEQLVSDWTCGFLTVLRSHAGSISTQPIKAKPNYFFCSPAQHSLCFP